MYRIGKKQKRAILTENGSEVVVFPKGKEALAEKVCNLLNAELGDNTYVTKSSTPYRCPICGGNGLVSGSFYTSLFGCGGTTTNITQPCRTCNGAGILWG